MKICRGDQLEFIPASHEDPKDPGVWKKVLAKKDELVPGRVQMINWARMEVGKAFEAHYHEDMQEVFIILAGKVEILVDDETETLASGDMVIIDERQVHRMKNIGEEPVEYIVVGISREQGGKTVNV